MTQSIRNPGSINVYGSYLLRADPDLALVVFDVDRVDAQPAEAFAATRSAVEQVRKFLSTAGVASADVQTTRTTLQLATTGYGVDMKVIGHRAKVGFSVTVRSLDNLESIVVGIVGAGAHSIQNVRFETSKLKELRAEARRGAVAAARDKAQVYASAAGVGVGKVLHIEDVNPESASRRGHAVDLDLSAFDESAGTPNGALTIAAAVMLAFAIVT
ncbi:MAG TPA: SIMPL domain-containing protein [Polyangiaceae bacterium]|nr:SIMPL domain-containing protein [Polyangiaceae bacterium]HMR78414.1 SIMPL domain-containing protein [Polyangiaceae bacterium]